MATRITRDQFVVKENEVVHTPTGARFIAEPNDGHAVQVIWGNADAILPAGHADGLPAAIAVHRFDGKGHMVHMEAVAEVNRLIEAFIGGA